MLQNVDASRARATSSSAPAAARSNFNSSGTLAAGARSSRSGPKAGYFTKGYNGLGYDPSWQTFGKGKGVFLISGSWLTADLKKALGKNVGFFLLPPPVGQAAGRRSAARACRGRSARSRRTPTPRRPTSTSSPTTRRCRSWPTTATHRRRRRKVQGAGAASTPRSTTRGRRRNETDAIVPYLDWATPTMYDTITAAIQELLAGKTTPRSSRTRSRPTTRSSMQLSRELIEPAPAASGLRRPARLRRPRAREPPGEPRRVAYLYLLPAFAVYALFVLAPLGHTIWLSLFAVGRADARRPGSGSTTTRRSSQTPSCAPRSSTRSS